MRVLTVVICLAAFFLGCATVTPREKKRQDVLKCVKDLKQEEGTTTLDAFEVCRQVYEMHKS